MQYRPADRPRRAALPTPLWSSSLPRHMLVGEELAELLRTKGHDQDKPGRPILDDRNEYADKRLACCRSYKIIRDLRSLCRGRDLHERALGTFRQRSSKRAPRVENHLATSIGQDDTCAVTVAHNRALSIKFGEIPVP